MKLLDEKKLLRDYEDKFRKEIIRRVNDLASSTVNSKKVYEALLTQSGTSAPSVTVLGNNDIGNIVWSYNSTGQYIGTLNGAFPSGKTAIELQKYNPVTLNLEVEAYAARASDNTVLVTTYTVDVDINTGLLAKTAANNGGLTNSFIRITVYN